MSRATRAVWTAGAVLLGTLLVVTLLVQTGLLPVSAGEFPQRELRVTDCDGTTRATVTVGVARTTTQRYVGLSRTSSLGTDEGLLFPFGEEASHRIEMRNMEFPLDVLYVGSDGRIRQIVTLPAPRGPVEYYLTYPATSGVGRYVVEVNAGWAESNGVRVGDCVRNLP